MKPYFVFSGGEVHCKIQPGTLTVGNALVWTDYTMNGFMALCEYQQVLAKGRMIHLVLPYLPYARQDRTTSSDEPFSLKIFCEFLNSRNFPQITVYDPHSDVVEALVNNINIIHQHEIVKGFLPEEFFKDPNTIFVSPDAGAFKKMAKIMPNDYKIAIGTKIRSEGKIQRTNIYSPCDLKDKTCVIIDDICDGGATFLTLGEALRRKGVKKMYLYVTHGIFSKGIGDLLCLYDKIYTTNSFDQGRYPDDGRLVVKDILSCW